MNREECVFVMMMYVKGRSPLPEGEGARLIHVIAIANHNAFATFFAIIHTFDRPTLQETLLQEPPQPSRRLPCNRLPMPAGASDGVDQRRLHFLQIESVAVAQLGSRPAVIV